MSVSSATGLPILPDGYFWRVTTVYSHPMIQLRKRTWRGSKVIDDRHILPLYHEGTEAAIRYAAETLLTNRDASAVIQMRYSGDYPPKKLGEA